MLGRARDPASTFQTFRFCAREITSGYHLLSNAIKQTFLILNETEPTVAYVVEILASYDALRFGITARFGYLALNGRRFGTRPTNSRLWVLSSKDVSAFSSHQVLREVDRERLSTTHSICWLLRHYSHPSGLTGTFSQLANFEGKYGDRPLRYDYFLSS